MFLIKWSKQFFNFFRKFISLNFCRIRKAIHHTCNSTKFKSFTNYIPTVHKEFCNPFRIHSVSNHFVITTNSSSLKHTTKNSLFTHKVRFYFSNKGRFKNTSFWTTHTNSQSLSISPTFSFWVIIRMNSNQIRNTKSALEFVPNFCTWTFWSTHNNSNIRANLHTFFNNIESVWIPQSRTFFHFAHNFVNNIWMLLIWSQVTNKVSSRNHFIISSNFKTIFSSIFPRLAFFSNSAFTKSIRNIKTRITQTHTLVQTLSSTTNNNDFFTFKSLYAVSKFISCHRTTFSKKQTSFTPRNWIKIIFTHNITSKKFIFH